MILFLWISGLTAVAFAKDVSYSGHLLIGVTPTNQDQLMLLRNWHSGGVDFWRAPSTVGRSAKFSSSPESYTDTVAKLQSAGLSHQILVADIGDLVAQEEQKILHRRNIHSGRNFDFTNYHTYEEIMGLVDQLISDHPDLVSKEVIGVTLEQRDIVLTTLRTSGGGNRKPIMFFDCGIHAREWISPATCLWIMNNLISNYGLDNTITTFLDTFDWKFILVANPDGYSYTWNSDRLWRKNRAPSSNISCPGVDLNRNFQIGFGDNDGSSGDPCSILYRGTEAFSEAETRAIRDVLASYRGRVQAAISVHSWGQQWLSPYAYDTIVPADYSEMMRMMNISVEALTATYGTVYEYGAMVDLLYKACGVSIDYYYEVEGILHSYTIELRALEDFGFILPPEYILPTAIETWNGLTAMTNEIIRGL